MGSVIAFSRKKPRKVARSDKQATWAESFTAVRPILLGMALLLLTGISVSARPFPGVKAWAGAQEQVDVRFGICGQTLSSACVTDGDTLRMGERRIRLVGFDTAEKQARCAYEAELAERSTLALAEWLNRGPFTMTGTGRDRYGRERKVITRAGADGPSEELARWMILAGGARSYDGGRRSGWC